MAWAPFKTLNFIFEGDYMYNLIKKYSFFWKLIVLILTFCCILSFFAPHIVFAATPKLINKLNDAFTNITEWLIKLSTPAAAVAVGIGIFMKKFSFGDEERIRTAKKLIRGSLFSYAFILAIQLILSAIKSLIG